MAKLELDGREFDFNRVTTQDALKVKSAMMILANEKSSMQDYEKANQVLDDLAFKYLKVKNSDGNWLENIDEYAFSALFENEMAGIEIVAKFQERLKGFLNALPSFQTAEAKARLEK
ncbi:hypothetical protein DUZ16_06570 [Campylobacter jejuni]|nr:hypothetical protein [Campylobacter jejuni]